MRTLLAAALLLATGACTSATSNGPKDLSAAEAVQQTCAEVLAGIDEFNREDYSATVEHFEKARPLARAYVEANSEPEARALLEAVTYYADLPPDSYPQAARTSEHFARYKAVTLSQCAAAEPMDATPDTLV